MTEELALVANAGDSTISTFRLAASGLHRVAVTPLAAKSSTFAVDAANRLVFACVGTGITTFALADDGSLSQRSGIEISHALAYLSLTPDGTTLLGASYHGGWGAAWPVGEDGVLGEQGARIEYPNLHCVVTDGALAYFVSLGADLIASYGLTPGGGLTPLAVTAAPKGSGPRHLVLTETNAYLITEFTGDVLAYAREEYGVLVHLGTRSAVSPGAGLGTSRFGADPRAGHLIWGADLHLSRDGLTLWATERSGSTIATLPVHPDGTLGAALAFLETEPQPRGFFVTEDARVLVAGERSTTISAYTALADGTLVLQAREETGNGANWVRTLTL